MCNPNILMRNNGDINLIRQTFYFILIDITLIELMKQIIIENFKFF